MEPRQVHELDALARRGRRARAPGIQVRCPLTLRSKFFPIAIVVSRRGSLAIIYRAWNKGMQILVSNSQAGPGRTAKQEQEEISRNHVQAFIPGSVC